jgi:predicted nucleic acid-binding protein
MLVVADTSPINYLVLIQHEAILPTLYEHVVIPPVVCADLRHARTPEAVRAWVVHPPAWFEVRQPRQPLDALQFPKLGAGEREAIALTQELQALLLLIDDADGREAAERRALTAIGTLGILENAAMHDLIDLPRADTAASYNISRQVRTFCDASCP